MGLMIAAAAWGFAEATLFFIVPDVLLSAMAFLDRRKAYFGCLAAAAGAAVGGALIYLWGAASPAAAMELIEGVPAISPEMMLRARDALAAEGVLAMIVGPLSGTPFKVYAVQAWSSGMPLWLFLVMTLPARLPRFLLVTALASVAARLLLPRIRLQGAFLLWFIAWAAFYAVYFLTIE